MNALPELTINSRIHCTFESTKKLWEIMLFPVKDVDSMHSILDKNEMLLIVAV